MRFVNLNRFTLISTLIIFGLAGYLIQMSYEDDSDFNKTAIQKTTDIENFIPSPLKQLKAGIKPEDVKCNDNYVLVLNITAKNPAACLKSETAEGRGYDRGTCKKPVHLQISTTEGVSPLTVGFFLNGTNKDRCSKIWFFGDTPQIESTFSNIKNHIYRYTFNETETSHKFDGHVNVTDRKYDPFGKHTKVTPFSVTVLKNNYEYLTSFDQKEGVVIKDRPTSFIIHPKITGSKIVWNFEDAGFSTISGPGDREGEHAYKTLGIINGNVSVTSRSADKIKYDTEYWKFTVLVIPKDG